MIYYYFFLILAGVNTEGHYGSPELDKHLSKSKMDMMELSDLHHPHCKINRKNSFEREVSEFNFSFSMGLVFTVIFSTFLALQFIKSLKIT